MASDGCTQAAFGPFYRIEQLILSTTPAAQAPYQTPSGLPAILTDANIRLLFQIQAAVDALAGPVAGSNASATLQQVCYKPLGDDCATQSILQVSSLPLHCACSVAALAGALGRLHSHSQGKVDLCAGWSCDAELTATPAEQGQLPWHVSPHRA